jgi:hypothetical protein
MTASKFSGAQIAFVRRRQFVDQMREAWKVSVRKAFEVLRIDRSLYTYKSRRGEQTGLKQSSRSAASSGRSV